MLSITNEIRNKIMMYKKNKLDISDLIKNVNIQGEDLSHCIIKDFHFIGQDLHNTNFFQSILGEEGKITSFINCNLQHCNFERARFLGKTLIHKCNAQNAIFRATYAPYVEYKFTDFRKATFCHVIIPLGTENGVGCIFDTNFFKDLTKNWGIEVEVREKESMAR